MTFVTFLLIMILGVWVLSGLQACTAFSAVEAGQRKVYTWCRMLTAVFVAIAAYFSTAWDSQSLGFLLLAAIACFLVGEGLMARKFLRSRFKAADPPMVGSSDSGRRSSRSPSKDDFTTI